MHIRRLGRRSLGRDYGWLWAAYAISAYGSGIGFGAFPLIAIRVLHSGPAQVSALSAAGLTAGAVVALPLGPWVEARRKRPVMMTMDLVRFAALLTIPASYALGWLTFAQLLIVSVLVAAAKIAFTSASGANLKALVKPEDLLAANGRFESTTWTALVVGPPLGGAAVGLLGPVTTVIADAVSYLLSAAGVAVISGREERPARTRTAGISGHQLLEGWRYIFGSAPLRMLFLNSILVGGLILATEPLLAVLMLSQLKFAPWQYTIAFGVPCIGGFIGSRLSPGLGNRFGQHRVLLASATLSVIWPLGLAFTPAGAAGVVLVMALQFALVFFLGVFNPVSATYRLELSAKDRVARTLSAWQVSKNLTIAALTAAWGILATLTSTRIAIAIAGLLLLATPLLLRGISVAPATGQNDKNVINEPTPISPDARPRAETAAIP